MRLRHRDGSTLHLAYGSNVHPAETVDGIVDQLATVASAVRAELDADVLGVGLWLAAEPAAELRRDPAELARLRTCLREHRLEVVTANAFPYGGFHAPVVKHAVYRPDWTDEARATYTLDVAHVLAELLPDDVADGSVSTLPIGWRTWVADADRPAARDAVHRVGDGLADLAERTGRTVRLGLEPEPGCVLETVDEVATEVAAIDHPLVGVAVDACHLAVEFEDPTAASAALDRVGGRAVKLQVSNALHVDAAEHASRRGRLAEHDEPRFLHQTRRRTADGREGVDDLGEALAGGLAADADWRVHVHVPVHDGDGTTRDVLDAVLDQMVGGEVARAPHLEVETYTWSVLPADRRPTDTSSLVAALAAELAWTRDALLSRRCEELSP